MKTITMTEWRRTSGRHVPELLIDGPVLITSNGKPLYEVHQPGENAVGTMLLKEWKPLAGWNASAILERGPVLVMRGEKPLYEARLPDQKQQVDNGAPLS